MDPRAKYTAEELKTLGEKGEAFRNADGTYGYPAADEADLKRTIRSASYGDTSHDPIRAYVIKRAEALKLSDLVPDTWNADGSLKETKSAWSTVEQRDTAMDVFTALEGAVVDAYEGEYGRWSVWVQDWYGDSEEGWTVVYTAGNELLAAKFDYDEDNKVVLEEPVKVRPVTSYVERAAKHEGRSKPNLENTIALRRSRIPRRGEREIRTVPIQSFELREGEVYTQGTEDNEGRALLRFVGYASVFDQRYSVGLYEEVITRGAFKRSLASSALDCVLRMEHVDLPLARTTGTITLADGTEQATLILAEDPVGLRVEALLDPEDPDVQRLVPKMRRKDLNEMSFAFRCIDDNWSEDYSTRTVRTAEIHRGDVSIVTYGASPTTTSTLRSEAAAIAIQHAGPEGFFEALTAWRDHTLLTAETRATETLSAPHMEVLTSLVDLFASDENGDESRSLLADLMGVPGPGAGAEREEPAEAEQPRSVPNYASLMRRQLDQLGSGR